MNKMSKLAEIQFPCDQCDHTASRKWNLLVHIKSKHKGVKYPCNQCDYERNAKD